MPSWSGHLVVALVLLPLVESAAVLHHRDRNLTALRGLHSAAEDGREVTKLPLHSSKVFGSRARSVFLQLAQLCSGPHVLNLLGHGLRQGGIQAHEALESPLTHRTLPSGSARGDEENSAWSDQDAAFVMQAPDVVIEEPSMRWYDAWLQAMMLRFALIAYAGLVCAVAYFYFRQKPVREAAMPELEDYHGLTEWKYGVCDCCSAPDICLCAWCCPAIRWAETLGMTGLMGFWLAFAIYLGVDFIGGIAGELLFWILLAVICTGFRQEMRIKFRMKKQGGSTYVTDCLLYFCCACCVMTQEARQVEEACKVGPPVEVPTVQVHDTT